MEYEFYIDLFFLMDFYLNFLSLFLSAALLRQTLYFGRFFLAAAIGSFWNCFLIVFPILPAGVELLVTIVFVGGIMLVVAFGGGLADRTLSALQLHRRMNCHGLDDHQRAGEVWIWDTSKKWIVSILRRLMVAEVSLLLSAGLINGCFSFSLQHFHLSDVESLVFTGLICLLTERFLRHRYKRERVGDDRYQVRLYYQGREKKFLALADSGNRLRVPDTGRPVSLISYRDCIGFCDTVSGGFYIPYRAVGTEKGLLFTVLFEKMEIIENGKAITIESPAVAIVKESLSESGDFSMILPEEYVLGE